LSEYTVPVIRNAAPVKIVPAPAKINAVGLKIVTALQWKITPAMCQILAKRLAGIIAYFYH